MVESPDLFAAAADSRASKGKGNVGEAGAAARTSAVDPAAPLAVRMRPQTLDELVGQAHLLTPGAPLRRLVEGDAPLSVILWGPPGSGKDHHRPHRLSRNETSIRPNSPHYPLGSRMCAP